VNLQFFGKPPTQASADRDIFSATNEVEAKRLGVKWFVLPKPSKKSEKLCQQEEQP
jgi:hypothetical protein